MDQKKIQSKADEILKIFRGFAWDCSNCSCTSMYMDITNTIDNANILLSSIRHGKMLIFMKSVCTTGKNKLCSKL